MHPSAPEEARTAKTSCAAVIPPITASDKQRRAASNNAYNYPIIAVSDFQIITPEPNKRVALNLECTMRWMCTIDVGSHPLL